MKRKADEIDQASEQPPLEPLPLLSAPTPLLGPNDLPASLAKAASAPDTKPLLVPGGADAPAGKTPQPVKKTRSRLACLGCKSTKQKCDGPTRIPCRRCELYNLKCEFPQSNKVVFPANHPPSSSNTDFGGGTSEVLRLLSVITSRLDGLEKKLDGPSLSPTLPYDMVSVSSSAVFDEEDYSDYSELDSEPDHPAASMLQDITETTDSLTRAPRDTSAVHLNDGVDRGGLDIVNRGILTREECQELFEFFFRSLHPWLMLLSMDSDRDAMAVRARSPLLFHTILLLSTFYSPTYPSQLHMTLISFTNALVAPNILSPQHYELTTDFVRAMLLLNLYKPAQLTIRRAEGKDIAEAVRTSKLNALASMMVNGITANTSRRLNIPAVCGRFARALAGMNQSQTAQAPKTQGKATKAQSKNKAYVKGAQGPSETPHSAPLSAGNAPAFSDHANANGNAFRTRPSHETTATSSADAHHPPLSTTGASFQQHPLGSDSAHAQQPGYPQPQHTQSYVPNKTSNRSLHQGVPPNSQTTGSLPSSSQPPATLNPQVPLAPPLLDTPQGAYAPHQGPPLHASPHAPPQSTPLYSPPQAFAHPTQQPPPPAAALDANLIRDLRLHFALQLFDILGHIQSGRRCNFDTGGELAVTRLFAALQLQPYDMRLAASVELYDIARPVLRSQYFERTRKIPRGDLDRFNRGIVSWNAHWLPLLERQLARDPLAMTVVCPFQWFLSFNYNASVLVSWRQQRSSSSDTSGVEASTAEDTAEMTAWHYACLERCVRAAEALVFLLSEESRIPGGWRRVQWAEACTDSGFRRLTLDQTVVQLSQWAYDSVTCVIYVFPLVFLSKLANEGLLTSNLELLRTPAVQLQWAYSAKLPRLLELGAAFLDAIGTNAHHPSKGHARALRNVLHTGCQGRSVNMSSIDGRYQVDRAYMKLAEKGGRDADRRGSTGDWRNAGTDAAVESGAAFLPHLPVFSATQGGLGLSNAGDAMASGYAGPMNGGAKGPMNGGNVNHSAGSNGTPTSSLDVAQDKYLTMLMSPQAQTPDGKEIPERDLPMSNINTAATTPTTSVENHTQRHNPNGDNRNVNSSAFSNALDGFEPLFTDTLSFWDLSAIQQGVNQLTPVPSGPETYESSPPDEIIEAKTEEQ